MGVGKLATMPDGPIFTEAPLVTQCVKVKHASEAEALAAAGKSNKQLHPYLCRLCQGWHNTRREVKGNRGTIYGQRTGRDR